MSYILFKLAYKKLDDYLVKSTEDIKKTINDLEKRKIEIEVQFEKLKCDFRDITFHIDNMVKDAEIEAHKIEEKSSGEINEMVRSKQIECEILLRKIRQRFLIEMKSKMVSLMTEALSDKLITSQNDQKMQNISIENSMKMLEELHGKYTKH
jgi:F0F1-type ATP synthase membrane subunit b/b'